MSSRPNATSAPYSSMCRSPLYRQFFAPALWIGVLPWRFFFISYYSDSNSHTPGPGRAEHVRKWRIVARKGMGAATLYCSGCLS